jgi:protein-S-isoprenylcysteine O-methyltransferase Ste14
VIAPPPLIFGVPLAVALYESRSNPLALMEPRVAMIAGGAIILVGLVFMLAAVIQLRRARTALMPYRPTTAIVERWPYSFSRNPIYLAMAIVYIGISIFFNTIWPFLLLPLIMLVMHRGVIEREERYLEQKFGSQYVDYRLRVRRWL